MVLGKIRSAFKKSEVKRAELKIQASLASSNMVLFSLSESILPKNKVLCQNLQSAIGAPLLENLFKLGYLEEVFINDDSMRVKFAEKADLKVGAGEVGKILRSTWDSGSEVIPLTFLKSNTPVKEEVFTSEATKSVIGKQINTILTDTVAPSLAAHGGHVTLVDIKDGYIHLSFGGGCQGCSQVSTTVKDGVEKVLLQNFPELKGVLDVSDHASGDNPYYR